MSSGSPSRAVASVVVERSRLVVVGFLLVTILLGAGVSGLGMASGNLGAESDEMEAYTYSESAFGTDENPSTLIVVHGENTLAKESLVEQLQMQEAIVADETVADTLQTEYSVLGVANVIAVAAHLRDRLANHDDDRAETLREVAEIRAALSGSHADRTQAAREGTLPDLATQRAQLDSMSQAEIDETVEMLRADEETAAALQPFLPTGHDADRPAPEITLVSVTHDADPTEDEVLATYDPIRSHADAELSTTPTVFSQERADQEIGQSTGDSLLLVGPLVLVLLLGSLAVAYRDPLDVGLGLFGVLVVLLWTVGFMGWAGIEFHFLFVAIPLVLVGLAIDFAIHLVMRYREAQTADGERTGRASVRAAMTTGLSGVAGAFLWVTATTTTGFLSNLVSTIPAIRQFGVVLSVGIVSTCVVFTTLIPALKTELDGALAARGFDRETRAFGSTGITRRLLSATASLATAAPVLVVVLVLLVSGVGAYGGTQIDAESDRTMFAPEQPPSWMDQLPEPFAPGEYPASEALRVVEDEFVRDATNGWVLVRGELTDSTTLAAVDRGHERATHRERIREVDSPLSRMRALAAQNDSFNRTFVASDTTGDGVPDTNLTELYEAFATTAPDAAGDVLVRNEENEPGAMRLIVVVEPGASNPTIDEETRAVASAVEADGLEVTPTGRPVASLKSEVDSRDAAIQGVSLTVLVIFVLLTIGYRWINDSWTLGGVTLFPMALLLSWVAGTMALLDVPLNALTAVIASFTVALGVDYCIHLSERYVEELERTGSIAEAVERAVVGTGGALAGGALTTATSFGILVLAVSPALEQFGLVMGMTVGYAFVVGVAVLPSMLVLWTRLQRRRNGSASE